MSDNDIVRYKVLKGLDIFEFWTVFDIWKQRIEAANPNETKRRNKK